MKVRLRSLECLLAEAASKWPVGAVWIRQSWLFSSIRQVRTTRAMAFKMLLATKGSRTQWAGVAGLRHGGSYYTESR